MSQARMTEILEQGMSFTSYDAGSEDTTPAFLGADITPTTPLRLTYVYATQESLITFNGSAKEAFLPKEQLMVYNFPIESINVKTVTEATGKLYWQGLF